MTAASAPLLGALAALASAFTWAIITLLVRTVSPPFSSVVVNAIRSLLGGALLLGAVAATGGTARLFAVSPQALAFLAVSIVVAIGVGDTVFFESTQRLGVGPAMTISTSYPLIATMLAAVLLAEPVSVRTIAGSLLTIVGLSLIVLSHSDEGCGKADFWPGVGTAALAALAWAVSVVLMKVPLREVDATTAQAIRLPVAGAVLCATPWARGTLRELRLCDRTTRWRLAIVGALTALSSVTFVAGLKYGGVAVASVLSSTAPMFAIPLGLLFLGERLSLRAAIGSAVTVAGVVLVQWRP